MTPRVQHRRVVVSVPDPLRLYRLRVVLHADVQIVGRSTPPMLVDPQHSLVGSSSWPLGAETAAGMRLAARPVPPSYVPSVRPVASGGFAILPPQPQSACQRDLVWAVQWRASGAPSTSVSSTAEYTSPPEGVDAERLPLPSMGVAVLEPVQLEGGTSALVAKAVRCPRGCTFRLVPHSLHGWRTPSAETSSIYSRPLERPPRHTVLELKFRAAAGTPQQVQHRMDYLRAALATNAPTAAARSESWPLLESRFGGEYMVIGVPRQAATDQVLTLLAALDAATRTEALDSALDPSSHSVASATAEPATPSALAWLARELDPHAGLLELLEDGTAVRRVAARKDESAGTPFSWLLLGSMLCVGLAYQAVVAVGSAGHLERALSHLPGSLRQRMGLLYQSVRVAEVAPEENDDVCAEADAGVEADAETLLTEQSETAQPGVAEEVAGEEGEEEKTVDPPTEQVDGEAEEALASHSYALTIVAEQDGHEDGHRNGDHPNA